MSTSTQPVESALAAVLTKRLLRYHVGQTIFCPGCRRILDWRKAVELDFYGDGTTRPAELLASRILCAACYDAKCADGKLNSQVNDVGLKVVPIDGRVISKRPKQPKAKGGA